LPIPAIILKGIYQENKNRIMRLRRTIGPKNLFLMGFVICFMLLSACLAEDSYAIVVCNDSEAVVYSEDFESYDKNLLDFTPIIGDVGISPSGHYFTYKGKTKMILADSGTQCVMQNPNIDYRAWVNATAAEGHSSLHIWAFIAPRQKLDRSEMESRYGYVYPGITPWARKTSGENAHDGGKQWDLFSFDEGRDPNQHYWPRLRDLCQQLKDKNMMLGITVFFGWPKDIRGDLYYHPFYHLNGGPATSREDITHIYSPGTEIHTQAWDDSWPVRKKNQWLWEKLCLKLINETSGYGNVWFDFRDEWSYDTDTNMESHFRHFFMDRGQVWADRSTSANFRVLNGDVPPFGLTPAMKTEGEPYDHNSVRVEVWTRAMAGIHYLLHNDARRPGIMAWDPYIGRDPDDDLGRKYVGYASHFFNTHLNNLDAMVPNNTLVSNGAKCLANPGNEYVVYLPNGGSVILDLSDATGTLNVEWYDPKKGTYYNERPVTGGRSETFISPFRGDVVLHISADTFPPTTVITPTPNEAGWNSVTQVTYSLVLTAVLVLVILIVLRHRKRDHGRR